MCRHISLQEVCSFWGSSIILFQYKNIPLFILALGRRKIFHCPLHSIFVRGLLERPDYLNSSVRPSVLMLVYCEFSLIELVVNTMSCTTEHRVFRWMRLLTEIRTYTKKLHCIQPSADLVCFFRCCYCGPNIHRRKRGQRNLQDISRNKIYSLFFCKQWIVIS